MRHLLCLYISQCEYLHYIFSMLNCMFLFELIYNMFFFYSYGLTCYTTYFSCNKSLVMWRHNFYTLYYGSGSPESKSLGRRFRSKSPFEYFVNWHVNIRQQYEGGYRHLGKIDLVISMWKKTKNIWKHYLYHHLIKSRRV